MREGVGAFDLKLIENIEVQAFYVYRKSEQCHCLLVAFKIFFICFEVTIW